MAVLLSPMGHDCHILGADGRSAGGRAERITASAGTLLRMQEVLVTGRSLADVRWVPSSAKLSAVAVMAHGHNIGENPYQQNDA